MKRIFLFLATNLAVMLVLSVTLRLLGVDRYLTANGLDVGALMIFSLVVGFAGSIISLLISKPLAKWSTGAHVIDAPRNADEAWLLSTVQQLAQARRHRQAGRRDLRGSAECLRHRRVPRLGAGGRVHRTAAER